MLNHEVVTERTVSISLRKPQRQVHVHSALLRSRSAYFKQVLARHGKSNPVPLTLNDFDSDTFCLFLSWLYRDRFEIGEDDVWMNLCKLWLLAERFEIPSLQNHVVEIISCKLYQRDLGKLDLESLHYVYDNTGPGSKLRLLLVHICTWYGNQDIFAQVKRELPQVFHTDYAKQQEIKARGMTNDAVIDPWNLTEFLLPEVDNVRDEDVGKVLGEEGGFHDRDERCDSFFGGDSEKKRKRGC